MDLRSTTIDFDDLDAVQEHFLRQRWTDGLPIVPPTAERVARFVKASGRPPDEVIAYLEPQLGAATIEKIAVNAVMAGCAPDYMPVLAAVTEGIARPAFGLRMVQIGESPTAVMVIINGPVRKRLQVHSGTGCLGPGWQANAAIGRFIRLLLINVGGGTPGTVGLSSHGMPGKYTFCFAEAEEESPWEPLHVERGLQPGDSAVTVVAATGTLDVVTTYQKAESILHQVADAIGGPGFVSVLLGGGEPTVILTTGQARRLAEQGFSKARVKEWLFEHAGVPLDRFPKERSTINSEASWFVRDGRVLPCRQPQDIIVVVAGGPEPYHATHVTTPSNRRSQTIRVAP